MAKHANLVSPSVHCRTGSLETVLESLKQWHRVHCRTGSLETATLLLPNERLVHCRTGSLEMPARTEASRASVHCRTGSLERQPRKLPRALASSLSYRQLRNPIPRHTGRSFHSLPYRQLINALPGAVASAVCSLPYRQLSDRGGYGRRDRAVKAEEGSGVRIKEMKRPGIIPAFSI